MTLGSQNNKNAVAPPPVDQVAVRSGRARRFTFGLNRFSGLYVWAALLLLFSLWIPDLFLTANNAQILAGSQAVTAIVALGLIVPVASGAFDLSIGGTISVSVCAVMWMQANGHGFVLGIVVALAAGIAIGLVNAFIVIRLRVDSFIATLGMGSVLSAVSYWITGGLQIVTGISPHFLLIGQQVVFGLPLPVFYMLAIGAVLWWVLEYTPAGRYLYATGGNPEAARLAGVRVDRLVTGGFITSGFLAALAGVVLAAELGSATPDAGTSYLLPAFSAVFLGATQIRPGRVNVIGTLVAIFLLATGVKGLQLAGAPSYVSDLFDGLALIVAVALAVRTSRKAS